MAPFKFFSVEFYGYVWSLKSINIYYQLCDKIYKKKTIKSKDFYDF